jgi:heptaprenylglyceryl phosphate synthase
VYGPFATVFDVEASGGAGTPVNCDIVRLVKDTLRLTASSSLAVFD